MTEIKMRTRMLPSMTNYEVESYLTRNDIIFVPVGVNEMHGAMPLDIEYVMAEAYSRLMAESVDGLVLPNLVYFTAGGTVIGRGTVYMSMQDSMNYLKSICYSLLNQGFRRIILVPAHGDSKIIINAVISQFLDETKCPMLFLDPRDALRKNGVDLPRHDFSDTDTATHDDHIGCATLDLGCYNICGRIDDVPTGEEVNDQPGSLCDAALGHPDQWPFEPIDGFDTLHELLGTYMPTAIYFDKWSNHGSQPLPLTREDVRKEGAIGEKLLREAFGKVNWKKYTDGLRKTDRFFQEVVLPKYGDVLPKNKFYPNFYGRNVK